MNLWTLLMHLIGAEPRTPSTTYNFWSGFGSDLAEFGIVGVLAGTLHAHNCHVHGCLRIRTHPVEGTPYKACRKHHPTVPERVTAEHIAAVHAAANPQGES